MRKAWPCREMPEHVKKRGGDLRRTETKPKRDDLILILILSCPLNSACSTKDRRLSGMATIHEELMIDAERKLVRELPE